MPGAAPSPALPPVASTPLHPSSASPGSCWLPWSQGCSCGSPTFPSTIWKCQAPGKRPPGALARLAAGSAASGLGALYIAVSYPRAAGFPKYLRGPRVGTSSLSNSPGDSQGGSAPSGGALPARPLSHSGMGEPLLQAWLAVFTAGSAKPRFVPSLGCRVPVAMETEVRPVREMLF